MNIETKYNIGQIVYLITDVDQIDRMVTSITVNPKNSIVYSLSCGTACTSHYEMELSEIKDLVKSLTSNV